MDSLSQCQIVLSKISEFYRININDPDEKIKAAIQNLLDLWPEVLVSANTATDDELFALNVSRAVLTQVFAIVLSKDFFNKDQLLVREIFFSLFNILVDNTSIFQDNNSIFIDSNIRLIIKMAMSITSFVQFNDGDLTKPSDHQLLIAIREHIDQDFKHDNLTDAVISFIWNLSDRTMLVPRLLKAGYAKSVVDWILTREMKFTIDKIDAPIHILHNLARHDDGIDQLNSYDALDVIEEIKTQPDIFDDVDDMTTHIAMIRTLLTSIKQIKHDSTYYSNKTVNMLLQLSINAAKNENYRYKGSHVSEPLTVLVKLFYNNEILDNILCKNEIKPSLTTSSIIELFTTLLCQLYSKINPDNDLLENYTCVVILNLFWLISNYEKYSYLIGEYKKLMDIVKIAANDKQSFIDTFMPRTMKSIHQTANDILRKFNNNN
ncbi:unnamed protein product [Adineta steineri]|uniref:Uncharacterized protein n=1 Tax=Adineta steineri TaxID=433720 RepID=A0A814G7B6_9BILA|nr:unnamed protein product [Adineta steineri]CAF3709844.1 unnamed protein product [Adineta steineri]